MGTIYSGDAGGMGLAVILQNSCCLGCMQEFETGFSGMRVIHLFLECVVAPFADDVWMQGLKQRGGKTRRHLGRVVAFAAQFVTLIGRST